MKQICIALVALLLAPLVASHAAEPSRPNVIFILTDDQGWADAHFAGHPYVKTPNLDRLASQGTWFKQFYVAATVCSPSRCAFMTSHFPARDHIHGHFATHEQNAARFMPDWLDPKTPTVTSILKQAGYATAHFGKWHLGSGDGAPPPEAYGIDVSRTATSNGPRLGEECTDPFFRAKSTALIVDETIEFITANKDRPFYANVWTLLPHAPLNPTPEQLAVYKDLMPSAGDFTDWMHDYAADAKDLKSQMQIFCASLTDLDTQLGRLFDALDTLKLADNTIVFFSSDNGPEDYRISNAANAGVGNPGPLRARKRSMYEGGIRTFGLVRWPGHVAAGRVDESSVVAGVDWLPTVCTLTGAPAPAGLDGEDVSDIWLGQSRPRNKPLHWEWLYPVAGGGDSQPPVLAIRDGNWKCFVNSDGSGAQLYEITKDVSELHDVAAAHPDLVKELTAKALAWQQSLPPSTARDKAVAGGIVRKSRKPASDRSAMFKAKDTNHDGQLTREEFLHNFSDQAEGGRRFHMFDTNHDGVLSGEEFITIGKP